MLNHNQNKVYDYLTNKVRLEDDHKERVLDIRQNESDQRTTTQNEVVHLGAIKEYHALDCHALDT